MGGPESTPEANDGYEEYFHLTPHVTNGGIDRSALPGKATEILLLSPMEDPSWSQINIPRSKEATSRVNVHEPHITATKGIQIICSFERTRQEMLTAELEKHAQLNKVSVEQLTNSFETADGIPVDEYLDQHISTSLIHSLYQALFLSVEQGCRERQATFLRWLPMSDVFEKLFAKTVTDEMHNDLCPEYFEQQFE